MCENFATITKYGENILNIRVLCDLKWEINMYTKWQKLDNQD